MAPTSPPPRLASRRRFLTDIARGGAALAAVPAIGVLPRREFQPAPAPTRTGPPDEAYWRQVKAQFAGDVLALNAANLCPAPRPVVDAVAAAITPRTRMVIVNSPNNPTGRVYGETTLTRLAA